MFTVMLKCYDIEFSDLNEGCDSELLYKTSGIERDIRELIKSSAKEKSDFAIIEHKDILKDWFPETECHIFMSHSHKDEKMAITIANALYKRYGVKTFIDSQFWGFVDDAIYEINNMYSRDDSVAGCMEYNRSMRVASNFYLILVNALTDAIYKSDSCWFINTKNSLNASVNSTYSPWLYTEINYTAVVKRTAHPLRPMPIYKSKDVAMDSINESRARYVSVKFDANTKHMTKVEFGQLINLLQGRDNNGNLKEFDRKLPFKNLDFIYQQFDSFDNK